MTWLWTVRRPAVAAAASAGEWGVVAIAGGTRHPLVTAREETGCPCGDDDDRIGTRPEG